MNHRLSPDLLELYRGILAQLTRVGSVVSRGRKAHAVARWFEPLEPRTMLSASISGQVFDDANANGSKDSGEGNITVASLFSSIANNDGKLYNG